MSPTSILQLIEGRREGYALGRDFYVREDVFARDLDLLLRRWTCAGHVASLPGPGAWLVAELGSESAIVVRGDDGEVRAFANVCRHRGSRICAGPPGRSAFLTCPYHGWSYGLDGALRAAREMPAGFVVADHGLKSLPLEVVGGLLFVSFDDAPPQLDRARSALADFTGPYGWEQAKVAHAKTYAIAANWKLALENYHECYHCALAHPEFSALHTLGRPKARRARSEQDWVARIGAAGVAIAEMESWGAESDGEEVARVIVSTLTEGRATGSRTGAMLAPAMGAAGRHLGGCAFAELGLLSAFLAYPDHGLIYRFVPRGVRLTEMEVIWLVAGDAVEGRDYDLAELTWLWDVTSLADKRIIEMNQAGVASRAYEPGPFSTMETGAAAYVDRYLGELAAIASGA